jgi:spermidine/putrescine transport system ATP-binding protein
MPLLEIRNVTRRFGTLAAVEDASFAVEAGEFFTLLGPSGCGKTTLLRMIAGFDRPDAGTIRLDGRDLGDTPPEARPIHTVFQSYALFPHMTVAENVAFALRMAGRPRSEIGTRVAEALERVRLADKADAMPAELSGGQKQRVALARSLVDRPRLLLLDEPLGALDAKLRGEMQFELMRLQREVGITFVFVTHSQPEALALSHRIAVMDRGRIAQIDTPAGIYDTPRNRFVADFIGHCNLLDCTVTATAGGSARLAAPGVGTVIAPARSDIPAGTRACLALRPEHLRITRIGGDDSGPADNRVDGRIHDVLYVGETTTFVIALADGRTLRALVANAAPTRSRDLATGDAVTVRWSADAGRLLP